MHETQSLNFQVHKLLEFIFDTGREGETYTYNKHTVYALDAIDYIAHRLSFPMEEVAKFFNNVYREGCLEFQVYEWRAFAVKHKSGISRSKTRDAINQVLGTYLDAPLTDSDSEQLGTDPGDYVTTYSTITNRLINAIRKKYRDPANGFNSFIHDLKAQLPLDDPLQPYTNDLTTLVERFADAIRQQYSNNPHAFDFFLSDVRERLTLTDKTHPLRTYTKPIDPEIEKIIDLAFQEGSSPEDVTIIITAINTVLGTYLQPELTVKETVDKQYVKKRLSHAISQKYPDTANNLDLFLCDVQSILPPSNHPLKTYKNEINPAIEQIIKGLEDNVKNVKKGKSTWPNKDEISAIRFYLKCKNNISEINGLCANDIRLCAMYDLTKKDWNYYDLEKSRSTHTDAIFKATCDYLRYELKLYGLYPEYFHTSFNIQGLFRDNPSAYKVVRNSAQALNDIQGLTHPNEIALCKYRLNSHAIQELVSTGVNVRNPEIFYEICAYMDKHLYSHVRSYSGNYQSSNMKETFNTLHGLCDHKYIRLLCYDLKSKDIKNWIGLSPEHNDMFLLLCDYLNLYPSIPMGGAPSTIFGNLSGLKTAADITIKMYEALKIPANLHSFQSFLDTHPNKTELDLQHDERSYLMYFTELYNRNPFLLKTEYSSINSEDMRNCKQEIERCLDMHRHGAISLSFNPNTFKTVCPNSFNPHGWGTQTHLSYDSVQEATRRANETLDPGVSLMIKMLELPENQSLFINAVRTNYCVYIPRDVHLSGGTIEVEDKISARILHTIISDKYFAKKFFFRAADPSLRNIVHNLMKCHPYTEDPENEATDHLKKDTNELLIAMSEVYMAPHLAEAEQDYTRHMLDACGRTFEELCSELVTKIIKESLAKNDILTRNLRTELMNAGSNISICTADINTDHNTARNNKIATTIPPTNLQCSSVDNQPTSGRSL